MRISMNNRLLCLPIFAFAMSVAQTSFGELLLNYQFGTVNGTAPTQTTIDSSGKHAEALNEVLGPGTTPGTDYPQQITGPGIVANSTVKSLNPDAYMNFTGPNGANNNSSRVRIADESSGQLDASFGQFTFAAWVNPSFAPEIGERKFAGKAGGGTASSNRGWHIASPGSGGGDDLLFSYFAGSASASGFRDLLVENVLPLNTWTHVAFTFNGTTGTEAFYINGVPKAISSITGDLTSVPATLNGANAAAFMVGARAGTATDGSRITGIDGWYGGLDDVRIYDQALGFTPIGSLTGTGSLLAAVPEPSSIALALLGMGALRYRRRTARKTSQA